MDTVGCAGRVLPCCDNLTPSASSSLAEKPMLSTTSLARARACASCRRCAFASCASARSRRSRIASTTDSPAISCASPRIWDNLCLVSIADSAFAQFPAQLTFCCLRNSRKYSSLSSGEVRHAFALLINSNARGASVCVDLSG
eukprot:CAMPEP_0181200194 /NCGR_PEP_ID=MMETSP1096-20121128/17619_1 /TAXON_ID=156174 ORGANISM="Chrysochromulina ericina, Strain CCMP281" /NCGR_SAMPLE_ID=MMETSP1096 /ASSEMBLY_ACC=CAM_ASM_000453 /LENGTH=142 /DNA_ID=CAMNT_0023290505 /DNA_START=193 /DNA_END=621 /DNA_ORIENTATION=-